MSTQKNQTRNQRIKKNARENPELPREFIKNILIAQEEVTARKLLPYLLENKK